jgi:flagellar protein FlaJ
MLVFVPLVAAMLVLASFVFVPYSDRLDRITSRLSFALFDGTNIEPDSRRQRLLRTAAIGTPYREYAAKTQLYVVGTALTCGVLGLYGAVGLVTFTGVGDRVDASLPELGVFTNVPPWLLWALDGAGDLLFAATGLATSDVIAGVIGMLVFGALGGAAAYLVRWNVPSVRADTRKRQINAGMPRMVAFVYALTRGGMAFPDVMRALSRNEDVFGESATEIGVAVRNIDLFSVDLVTAVRETSRQSPSSQFEQFAENLGSVLQSGGSISDFLHNQYERYREEAEEQQREILDLLATTAEVYVTVVVAGMLFLITTLFIIGVVSGSTLFPLRVIAYVLLPAVNVLFIAYLYDVTQPLRISRDSGDSMVEGSDAGVRISGIRSDGGYHRPHSRLNHGRLKAQERIRSLRGTLTTPVQSLIEKPVRLFYATAPLVLAVTAYRLWVNWGGSYWPPGVTVRLVDDFVVQGILFLLATFTVVYELKKRRLRRLEGTVPNLLDRLASLNEAGTAVVSSFDRVRQSDLGPLDDEVERAWRDIEWGATVEQALERFENRVQTASVTRVVTLITNAMRASNEIGPVLRIAAEQARADRRLRRQRRQEMLTYLVVIYISFVVFLIVIVSIDYVLIPNLPDAGAISTDTAQQAPGVVTGVGAEAVEPYRLVFFHATLVQSLLSGLVGGMMGGGSLKDGGKHATIMLTVTYAILIFLG